MNTLSRRLAACLVAGAACLVAFAPSAAGAATQPRLHYYGGHVLSHVKVDVVVWGSWSYGRTVPLTGTRSISSFFSGITASKHLDWLSEYDTPTQHIKRGTLEGVYTVHPPTASDGATVSDSQIATALYALIDTGKLPKPSTNRLYAIFFRSGQKIVTRDGNSTDDFCAYHDTMPYKSSPAYIAIIPYEQRGRGCKPAKNPFDNVTTIVSHELIEAITDPGVGLNRIAWYDESNGEVADICARISTPAAVIGGDGVSYVVQREWSNRGGVCIVSR